MDTGEKIKLYRKLKGMTQHQLAEQSGIHPVSIRKYEAGMMRPKTEQIQKLADAMGINTFLLQGRQPAPLKYDSLGNLEDSILYLLDLGVLIKKGETVVLNPVLEDFLVNER